MNAELYVNGTWLTTVKSTNIFSYASDEPVDFDRALTMKADFSAEVLAEIAKRPEYEVIYSDKNGNDVARGTTEGVNQDGVIVRMKNSEFQKLRKSEAE